MGVNRTQWNLTLIDSLLVEGNLIGQWRLENINPRSKIYGDSFFPEFNRLNRNVLLFYPLFDNLWLKENRELRNRNSWLKIVQIQYTRIELLNRLSKALVCRPEFNPWTLRLRIRIANTTEHANFVELYIYLPIKAATPYGGFLSIYRIN